MENSMTLFKTNSGWFKLNPKYLSKLNATAPFKYGFSNVMECTLLFSAISGVPY